ncbi:MAG: hypothetical protein II035_03665 [Firmicutes bacterium]|nr:hypothetical protein [Bacillota bacterium]MBQ1691164.1 hypothetical protein [Bacillota bacterium]MBQ1715433.1 hypothetical protein [Bacillota bacterium]MBQ2304474.1 hypothetical protein [Bacillota bacterium]MEE3382634.1 DUF5692 family protein [Anaerovoracaceae bacterium]
MLFQLYSSHAGMQLLGWVLVFCGLIIMNEIGRRTKAGGMVIFVIIPVILTVYFILAHMGMFGGENNPTVAIMDGWFHYFKLYAADIGCVGFMMIKYKWGLGKYDWFKWWPWFIVAANIMIANVSDMESFLAAYHITGDFSGAWWASNEGVFIYGGWWNLLNAIAGLINIFCMTGCTYLLTSKDKNKSDMIWPDMTIWFIIAYDVWNFEYTYLNLPTHSWYCGVALLLAPTFANALWNKGGWIQNRANTLAIWCMWAQVVPAFQLSSRFAAALPSVYGGATANGITAYDLYAPAIELYKSGMGKTEQAGQIIADMGITADPRAQGVLAIAALTINVVVMAFIIQRSIKMGKNPYSNCVWEGTRDFEEAMERAEAA